MKLLACLITLLFFTSCNQNKQTTDTASNALSTTEVNSAERMFNSIDLEMNKNDLLSKYQSGFSSCRPSGQNETCFWEGGESPFDMVTFRGGRISSAIFRHSSDSLSNVVAGLIKAGKNPKVEPNQMGTPVDNDTLDLIKHGGMQILDGADQVKVGDVLNFGCNATLAYYKGTFKYIGTKGDIAVRECTDDVAKILVVKGFIYKDKDHVD